MIRAKKLLLLGGGLALAAVVGSIALWSWGGAAASLPIATVNGQPITAKSLADYSGVYTNPDGVLAVAADQVFLSLVAQELVRQEAERRGISVDPSEIDRAVDALTAAELAGDSFARSGGLDGFRRRMHRFLEFEQVKEVVVGSVQVSDADVEQYLSIRGLASAESAALGELTGEELGMIRDRIARSKRDERWKEWVASRIRCASIEVLDARYLHLASGPGDGC